MIEREVATTSRRFLIVDDHPLFREALRSALGASFPGARIDEADTIAAARAFLAPASDVDLILLDLTLQRFENFDGLISLRKEFPAAPVLIVSGLEEPRLVHEALCLGASGFVPKAAGKAALADAIAQVLSGRIYIHAPSADHPANTPAPKIIGAFADRVASLTPSQRRVLALLRRGMLNREIAGELGVGESTIKAHVSEIIRKLGVISRTQIVIETARHDLASAQTARDLC